MINNYLHNNTQSSACIIINEKETNANENSILITMQLQF